jgi:hypothetical protein
VNKIGFAWVADGARVYFNYYGFGNGTLVPEVRIQGTPTPPDGARNYGSNRNTVSVTRGQWHRWEVILVDNTGDNADGEIHFWLDGVKVGEYRDVRFTSAHEKKAWQILTWRPIWGGGPDTVSETMYMWMDHYYASGGN